MNGYILTRAWYKYIADLDGIKPIHHCLFFYLIDLSNRLHWKKEFGVPTIETMQTCGISNTKTYYKAMDKLAEIMIFSFIEKSRNQFTATRIAMVFFDIAEAIAKTQQSPAIAQPLLTYKTEKNNGTYKKEETSKDADGESDLIINWFGQLKEDALFIELMEKQHNVTADQFQTLLKVFYRYKRDNEELTHESYKDLKNNFRFWIPKRLLNKNGKKQIKNNGQGVQYKGSICLKLPPNHS